MRIHNLIMPYPNHRAQQQGLYKPHYGPEPFCQALYKERLTLKPIRRSSGKVHAMHSTVQVIKVSPPKVLSKRDFVADHIFFIMVLYCYWSQVDVWLQPRSNCPTTVSFLIRSAAEANPYMRRLMSWAHWWHGVCLLRNWPIFPCNPSHGSI